MSRLKRFHSQLSSRPILWGIVSPLWAAQRWGTGVVRQTWWNRSAEISSPGLRVDAGARVHCCGELRVGGKVLIGRGATVSVPEGSSLQFAGDNYVLHGSQLAVGSGGSIRIGTRTTVDRDAIINGDVRIGSDCLIAPRVFISSSTHSFDPTGTRTIREMDREATSEAGVQTIVVGDNCWLGVGAVLLPGVQLGSHTVVGAGAVVTKAWPDGHQVLVGVPARPLPPPREKPAQST